MNLLVSIRNAALGAAKSAFVDALEAPVRSAAKARLACARSGKPLLHLGIGLKRHPLIAAMVGPGALGDVNLDLARPPYLDAAYAIQWPDRTFGALLAVRVLERLRDPARALAEWRRVADEVVVVLPAALAWLDPSNRWYVASDLSAAYPIWQSDRRAVRLT